MESPACKRRPRMPPPAAWLALLGLLPACREGPSRPATLVDLHRGLLSAHRISLCAPDEILDAAQRAAQVVRWRGLSLATSSDPSDAPPDAVRVVLADASTATASADLLEAAGIGQLPGGGFSFASRTYTEPEDAVFVTIEDPARRGRPLNLAYAASARDLLTLAPDLTPSWRPGFRVFRRGTLEREGHFGPGGRLDLHEGREIGSQRARTVSRYVRLAFDGFAWKVPPPSDRGASLEAQRQALRETLRAHPVHLLLREARERAQAVWPADEEPVDDRQVLVTGYPTIEEKVLATGDWRGASMNTADLRVHLVLAEGYAGDPGAAWARAYALQRAGTPAALWLLDGAGVHCAGRWWGHDLDDWLAHLLEADLVPGLTAVVAGDPRLSPHVLLPLRGALVRWILEVGGGADELRALWSGESDFDADRVGPAFSSWLESRAAPYRERHEEERAHRLAAALTTDFRCGVHLAPDHWFDRDPSDLAGYGGASAEAALDAAVRSGADAVALSNFAYVDRGWPDHFGLGAGPATAASDAALFHTLLAARARGLRTMLRPHLVGSRSTTWSTWMPLPGYARWARALSDLEGHLVHYALLAELAGCDLLCLGSGLRAATDTDKERPGRVPADFPLCDLKLERWKGIIARARAAFGGGLTYGALNVAELISVEFWPELDLVGLDLYPPLYDSEHPERWITPSEIERQFQVALIKLRDTGVKARRPVLLTEVGLPSAARSRLDPRWLAGEVDLAEQERLYEALAQAVEESRAESQWLRGAFVWRWSTDPATGGSADRGWTPRGKPAEAVLSRLFREVR